MSAGSDKLLRDAPRFHIALVHPEIPQNTGNIGRLSVGLQCRLHLVRPLGFRIDQKAVRRAGIDHWRQVDLQVHQDLDAFLEWAAPHRLHFFTGHAAQPHRSAVFRSGDVLVFGRESSGLPQRLRQGPRCWRLPIPGPVRSLNLSNAVAVAAYEALLQIAPDLFAPVRAKPGGTG